MIKSFIFNIFSYLGISVTRLTKKDKIIQLVKALHPIQTEHNLVRIGPNGDGGYLVPDDLENILALFSPGVDQISEFEKQCSKLGYQIFMADKSVERPNLDLKDNKYSFIKKFIGSYNNNELLTMDDWVNSVNIDKKSDLILQMDIEGSEYESVINISDDLLYRFRIIIIEFHNLQDIWNSKFFPIANTVFNKILKNHHCVHIHPNNCSGIDSRLGVKIPRTAEFTFLRKDRVKKMEYQKSFPHPLDFDNVYGKKIVLPKNWYSNK